MLEYGGGCSLGMDEAFFSLCDGCASCYCSTRSLGRGSIIADAYIREGSVALFVLSGRMGRNPSSFSGPAMARLGIGLIVATLLSSFSSPI